MATPGQSPASGPNPGQNLNEAASSLRNLMETANEGLANFSTGTKNIREEVAAIFREMNASQVKNLKAAVANIENTVVALEMASKDLSGASKSEEKRLAAKLGALKNMQAKAWAEAFNPSGTLASLGLGKYGAGNYATSQNARLDALGLGKYFERMSLMQSRASSADVAGLLGKPQESLGGPGVAEALMGRGMEGEVAKMEIALQHLYATKIKMAYEGVAMSKEEEALRLDAIKRSSAEALRIIDYENQYRGKGAALASAEGGRIAAGPKGATQLYQNLGPTGAAMARPLLAGMIAKESAGNMGAGATAISKALGSLASLAGSLSVVSMMGKAFMLLVGALDSVRKVQGQAIPALMVGAATGAREYEKFGASIITDNADIYSSLSGTKEFFPLVGAALQGMTQVTSQAARSGVGNNEKLVRSLMQVGEAGKSIGKDYGDSMTIGAEMAEAFAIKGDKVSDKFNEYIKLSKIAGMGFDGFRNAFGGVLGMAEKFGSSGADQIMKDYSVAMGSLATAGQKMAVTKAFQGMLGEDVTTRYGVMMAAYGEKEGGQRMLAASEGQGISGEAEMKSGQASLLKARIDAFAKIYKEKFLPSLEGVDDPARRKMMITQMMGSNVGYGQGIKNALMSQTDLENSSLFKLLMGEGSVDDAAMKQIKAAYNMGDPNAAGVEAMNKNTDALSRIENMLSNFFLKFAYGPMGKISGMNPTAFMKPEDKVGFGHKEKAPRLGKAGE